MASAANIQAQSDRERTRTLRLVGLLLILLALRLPLWQHPIPVDVDETSFIAAIGFPASYPVHHPGYPLWVGLGTLGTWLGFTPYAAFAVWSLLASLAAPLLLYLGLRRILDDTPAWWLGLAFGVNPLIWFHATTALSYLCGGTLGLLVVGMCWKALVENARRPLIVAASVLAIGLWLRADLVIYLTPMLLYTAWKTRRQKGLYSLLIPAVSLLLCIVVTRYLYTRGTVDQPSPSLTHTIHVILGTSAFHLGLMDGLLRNVVKIGINIIWDYGIATIPLGLALLHVLRLKAWPADVAVPAQSPLSPRLFLALWVGPAVLFLLLMHVVQGYFMLLIPAGYCAIGLYLKNRASRETAIRLIAAIAICSALQFTLYPWSAESSGTKRLLDAKIAFQSYAGLKQINRRTEIHTDGDFWHTPAHDEGEAQERVNPALSPKEP